MGRRTGALLLSLLVLAVLGGTAFAQTGDGFDLSWNVMGGAGGVGPLEGSGFSLDGTLGQTAIGPAAGGTFTVQQGYWYGAEVAFGVYLPLVFRGW
jgi:hypothetical protein